MYRTDISWPRRLRYALNFHRLRGCVVDSQFTMWPSSSPSSLSALSSVAVNRFLNDSWTSPAFLSFFSNEGRAAFLGGASYTEAAMSKRASWTKWHLRTGVLRYVCLGGREGRYRSLHGSCRSVTGMTGTASSSSDGSSSGDGERDGGGLSSIEGTSCIHSQYVLRVRSRKCTYDASSSS